MTNLIRPSILFLLFTYVAISQALANDSKYITSTAVKGSFPISVSGKNAPLYIDANDYAGVMIALKNLQADILAVTGNKTELLTVKPLGKQVILVGTIGKSKLIDGLIKSKKLNVSGVSGKWETFIIQSIQNPMPGVSEALVIAGSDKRGTIFGIYDISQQIGVSPWYYWADVPVKHHTSLFVSAGRHTMGTPAVKYRGIFINDEAPAFSGWAKEKFGGLNHLVYEKVFELILRLKGNYLWPAMWGNAFNDDDKLNPVLADEYGVVMGTSHHEPMDRAQQEWKRYGNNIWNYETNATVLQDFWRKGIQNMGKKETIVTVGMRGDGDMAMAEGSNVALLEKIVKDQRRILSEETHKDAAQTPQLWALYKEVQDYYDKGMRVPDDITLLLCDDNWGNIRKLPKLTEGKRGGGYGIYYHFDYVGDPRNYKWLNTNPISKVWEQMHLAADYGANNIWIVNVGDIKPMEFPISFFLDYAWSPKKYPANSLQQYTEAWAANQFGKLYAADIADIISKYSKYNGRRKPELLNENTYSLTNYNEFETVVNEYDALEKKAQAIYEKMPADYKDAYFELVLHPVKACANLYNMYFAVAKNKLYAKQNRAATNDMAALTESLFKKDAEISAYYNHTVASGKWNHMMDQTHISYTYWQQPPFDKVPDVKRINVSEKAQMAVVVEGNDHVWPDEQNPAELTFFPQDKYHYLEVFNRGAQGFNFTARAADAWLKLNTTSGTINKEQRIEITIDRSKLPVGAQSATVIIKANDGQTIKVMVKVSEALSHNHFKTFLDNNGYISIEAQHYSKAVNCAEIKWNVLPDYGRTLSGVSTFPVTASAQTLNTLSPHLEYAVNISKQGEVKVSAYVSPSLDFNNTGGLKFAVSVDDDAPQVMNLHAENTPKDWQQHVADNINILTSPHVIVKPGAHIIKYWMISTGVVLQKLVIDCGGLKPTYLGPPESPRH